jgi:cytochrome c-type biogenesis protein CcmH
LTTFYFACGGLILLSSLFYLFSRVRPDGTEEDLEQANLEWFRRRRAELVAEGDDSLDEDTQLRLLEEEFQRSPSPVRSSQQFPAWILFPLVALLSCTLYYFWGAAPDVLITRQMENLPDNAAPEQMRALIQDIEARSSQRPDNLHYQALLGRYYMSSQDYARATQAYQTLVRGAPEDAQALAFAAQAEYLAAGRVLDDGARLQAEKALAADPHQRTALGLLGMASFEQQKYRAAIAYWGRLVQLEPPGSESARMIAGVIETARQRLAETDPAAGAEVDTPPTAAVESGLGVTVSVTVPASAVISASDTVFVLARNADSGSRMPIAVQRITGADLPVTLRLDDTNSMAGQKMSDTASVVVAVQVSPSGKPGEGNATWVGEVGPLAPALDDAPLDIILRRTTP